MRGVLGKRWQHVRRHGRLQGEENGSASAIRVGGNEHGWASVRWTAMRLFPCDGDCRKTNGRKGQPMYLGYCNGLHIWIGCMEEESSWFSGGAMSALGINQTLGWLAGSLQVSACMSGKMHEEWVYNSNLMVALPLKGIYWEPVVVILAAQQQGIGDTG